MGYLHRSCIDEDVHDTGDVVEHLEEDDEQQAGGSGLGYKRVHNCPVYNANKQAAVVAKF